MKVNNPEVGTKQRVLRKEIINAFKEDNLELVNYLKQKQRKCKRLLHNKKGDYYDMVQ